MANQSLEKDGEAIQELADTPTVKARIAMVHLET
jgi:hypothetical protein